MTQAPQGRRLMRERKGRKKVKTLFHALMVLVFLQAAVVHAELELPNIFSDHMVLQRDRTIPVWGRADPGTNVTVTFSETRVQTQANPHGQWRLQLPTHSAGGPHTMTVEADRQIILNDIMVGEVWICSGQSNMEWQLDQAEGGKKDSQKAFDAQMRFFKIPHQASGTPVGDVDAQWKACEPGSANDFSAVGYYFGAALRRDLGVPVGLIQSAWGGSLIEPWTPREGFAMTPKLAYYLQRIDDADRQHEAAMPAYLDTVETWLGESRQAVEQHEPVSPIPPWPAHPLGGGGSPTALYHGMIQPLVPFAIRGAIWYQGESNIIQGDTMEYFHKMQALIGGWRKAWGQADFPFYFVQIAPLHYSQRYPDQVKSSNLVPRFWEAQRAALSIPGTGMAVLTDVTELDDIHPRKKLEVGERLARWALAETYGRDDVVASGPLYRWAEVEGECVRVRFDYAEGGLATRDGNSPSDFEIAEEDGKFVPASARIDGETLLLEAETVHRPTMVRFGWNEAAQPNLINQTGLPAAPFNAPVD